MDRREAIAGFGLAAATASASLSNPTSGVAGQKVGETACLAAGDAFVDFLQSPESDVEAGKSLYRLKSRDLPRHQARLDFLSKSVAIVVTPLQDGHADHLVESKLFDKTLADVAQALADANSKYGGRYGQASANLFATQAEVLRTTAKNGHKSATLGVKDARDMHAVILSYIELFTSEIAEQEKLFEGLAPSKGRFRPVVSLGTFVPRGATIGYFSSGAKLLTPGVSVPVYAPMDAVISSSSLSGESIEPGRSLISFRSLTLQHFALIALCFSKSLEIAERPFKDGRVDDLLAEVPFKIAAAEAAAASARVNSSSVYDPQNFQSAELLKQKAILEIEQKFGAWRAKDAQELLELAKGQLEKERENLRELEELLTLTAQKPCRFKSYYCAGSFVEKGQLCGEILT